ncbi:MAG TPA: hypothetical protein VFP84_39315 [Kofleriaceae bacterium]|nr:hypothetical protein [Kofleriaceae bacterium]
MIGRLPPLVEDVVACLDSTSDALASAVVACNAALEHCLESARGRRDDHTANARDDLQRLLRLLAIVERDDVPFVLRQIRRVLGRLDL